MSCRSGSGRSRISCGTQPTTPCPSCPSCCARTGAIHIANKHACMIASRVTSNHTSLFQTLACTVLVFLPDLRGTPLFCKFIFNFRSPRRSERSIRNRVALFPPGDRPPSAGSCRFQQFLASTHATKSSKDHLLFAKNGPLERSPLPD